MNPPAFAWMILLPLAVSPLVYLAGHFGSRVGRKLLGQRVALIGLLATWIPLVLASRQLEGEPFISFSWGELTLRMDGISLVLGLIALLLGTLVVIYSANYIAEEPGQEKFYAMLVAMTGVMIGLGCATDLFNLWIWFEAMAVSSYLLVAYYHTRSASLEAGFKYLIQSATGSLLILLGIGLVLSQTGTLALEELSHSLRQNGVLQVAGVLFVVGYGVKTALVPLHTWLPDAHSQAPSGISAMLSGVVIEAGLVAMLRSISPLASLTSLWGPLLLGCGVLNMVVGNLLAYAQSQVKRMLAYSSIVHMGYMLVGLGVTFILRDSSGAQGGLFHLINHGLMKGLAFLAAGSLLYSLHSAKGDHRPLQIEDLAGAARRYPLTALMLSLAVLSLAGLPPLAGFMSKWLIFKAGFESGQPIIWVVVILVAANSVFSLAYYAPIVNMLYRRTPSEAVTSGRGLPVTMSMPLVILALAIIVIGIWPNLLTWLTGLAGDALVGSFGL
jgi:proton-translocating NADH-quinone oxidoreductase chain N